MGEPGKPSPDPRTIRRVRVPRQAELVFEGSLFKIYQWRELLFDGSYAVFEMAKRPDNVVVLAIENGMLLVTKQEQPGIPGPFFDFPGGRVEPPEKHVEAAAREMLEETGFAATSLELIFQFQPSDRIDSLTSVFRASGLRRVSTPQPDEGERLELHWLSLGEVHRWALVNQRLALAPVMLARDISELATGFWLR